MRLRSAANNQATRRNEIIKSYLQLGSSSNRYAPRLPQQETKSSTKQLAPMDPILGPENLLKTGFAQKGLPSCPSGRHKPQSFIETKRCASATLIQKTSKNEPKHGPKNGTAWRSHFLGPHAQLSKRTKEKHFHGPIFGTVWRYQKRDRKIAKSTAKADPCDMRLVKKMGPPGGPIFWDRMHSLVKEQKKSTFTVPFLGPSGGTKKETAKSQNQQQRPTRATNKK